MSWLFEELQEGLKQAIKMEKGTLSGRKTTITIEPVQRIDGNEVRRIRKECGMTQKTLAAYLGVSQKTVEFWEQGMSTPNGSSCRLMSLLDAGIQLPFIKKIAI